MGWMDMQKGKEKQGHANLPRFVAPFVPHRFNFHVDDSLETYVERLQQRAARSTGIGIYARPRSDDHYAITLERSYHTRYGTKSDLIRLTAHRTADGRVHVMGTMQPRWMALGLDVVMCIGIGVYFALLLSNALTYSVCVGIGIGALGYGLAVLLRANAYQGRVREIHALLR